MSQCICKCPCKFTLQLNNICNKQSPDKFPVVRNVNRVWISLACLPCKCSESGYHVNE